ncbi:MAG TPA: cytochrome c biogenesis protein CcsA [Roseiflexaceae bacterium]|nr:cytochrome c biogenesis protein CcsA [Roseiflexaceae bacterium]HMP40916.1 cytochrome c biogenesis protein CcsA [Roseiflexaceae bacterium]
MRIPAQLSDGVKLLIGIWMAGVVIAMFLIVPEYVGLGDAGRIIIMHVPTAWITTVAFAISAFYSALYLWRRQVHQDAAAVAAAEVGFLFCVLATVSGAIFAQIVWGVFWNWDPRETSILVLLLIYAAYFALRSAVDDQERRRRLSAAYNLFAAVTMPFLLFVAPRVAESSLHPNCAFIQGSRCEGVTLTLGGARIAQLGDLIVELKGLEARGDLVVAQVEVRTPGLAEIALLEPTYELASGSPADRPEFPGQQFMLALEAVDLERGTALVNMEAPGTGLLSNQRTLGTFMAANIGFLALSIWLYRLRADLIMLQERLAQRGGIHELPA